MNPLDQYQVFRGMRYQRGHGLGLGNAFGYLRRWIAPFFKKKFLELKNETKPLLEEIGKSVIDQTSKVAKDLIEGQNIKRSAKRRFDEFENRMNELSQKAGNMEGNGFKSNFNTPLKKIKKSKKRRKRDIFDKKWKWSKNYIIRKIN